MDMESTHGVCPECGYRARPITTPIQLERRDLRDVYANGGRNGLGQTARDVANLHERLKREYIVGEYAGCRIRGWSRSDVFRQIRDHSKKARQWEAWQIDALPGDCKPDEELLVPSDETIEKVLDAAEFTFVT